MLGREGRKKKDRARYGEPDKGVSQERQKGGEQFEGSSEDKEK